LFWLAALEGENPQEMESVRMLGMLLQHLPIPLLGLVMLPVLMPLHPFRQ
jgi:hypothetical protein